MDEERQARIGAAQRRNSVPEPPPEKQPVFFRLMMGAVGIYVAVRLVEGALCVASWLGWGSCPWAG